MSRRCQLVGTRFQTGNNVSHSKIKTKRRFLPNLQNVTFKSDLLNQNFSLRITAATIRSVDHNGGLDNFLLSSADKNLTVAAGRIKRKLQKAQKAVKAAS